jgi:hypothetical protein
MGMSEESGANRVCGRCGNDCGETETFSAERDAVRVETSAMVALLTFSGDSGYYCGRCVDILVRENLRLILSRAVIGYRVVPKNGK